MAMTSIYPGREILQDAYCIKRFTRSEIARNYGVTVTTVTAWLRRANIEILALPVKPKQSIPEEELRRLYLEVGLSGADIAKAKRITYARFQELREQYGIPAKARGEKLPCPYSKAKLEEMYCFHKWTTREIAAHASSIQGRNVSLAPVRRWLRDANIKLRDNSQTKKIEYRKSPEMRQKLLDGQRHANTREQRAAASLRMKKIWRKGQRLANKWAADEAREVRVCAYSGCGGTIVRKRSEYGNAPERTFCGHSCANRQRRIDNLLCTKVANPDTTSWPQWAQDEYAKLNGTPACP